MPSEAEVAPSAEGAIGGGAGPPRSRRRSLLRDLIEVVALAALVYLLISFAVRPVHVEGTSMVPTLQNNNLLLSEQVSLYFGGPSRGDIVVIQPPISSPTDFIKRVIGLPGEWIRIAPNKRGIGRVYISEKRPTSATGGTPLSEPYINGIWRDETVCCTPAGTSSPLLPSTGRWAHIPAHDYFMLGDNRNFSEDSRTFGWEPAKGLRDIAIARFWPVTRLALLPGTRPAFSLLLGGLLFPMRRWRWRRRR
ncbi:MAG: signal peptidase I [Candidatus Dormibacteria bacterium]